MTDVDAPDGQAGPAPAGDRAVGDGAAVAILDVVTLPGSAVREWLERLDRDYLPGARRRGMRLTRRWWAYPSLPGSAGDAGGNDAAENDAAAPRTVDDAGGDDGAAAPRTVDVHLLWEIPDLAGFWTMRRTAKTQPEVAAFWAGTDALALRRERKVLVPAGPPPADDAAADRQARP